MLLVKSFAASLLAGDSGLGSLNNDYIVSREKKIFFIIINLKLVRKCIHIECIFSSP